jgi:hypothetical protein
VVGQGFESPLRLHLQDGDRSSTTCRIAAVLPQIIVDPTTTPTLNNGGWVYNAAVLLAVLGVIVALALVFGYMRFAPRFQTDEGARRSVRAPRIQPGRDVRRPVNVTSAPVVVEPPTIAGAPVPAPAAPQAAPAAAQAAPAAPQAVPAAQQAAPAAGPAAPTVSDQTAAAAGAAAPPAAQPVSDTASAAPSSPAPAAPVAASTQERPDVTLDDETFQSTLAELIAKGTDRRVAEGQARRAAMIAARKKAGG